MESKITAVESKVSIIIGISWLHRDYKREVLCQPSLNIDDTFHGGIELSLCEEDRVFLLHLPHAWVSLEQNFSRSVPDQLLVFV